MNTAMEAKAQLSSHERLCTERWEQSRAMMNEVRDNVKALLAAHERQTGAVSLSKMAVPMVWTVFAAVITTLAWLAIHFAPHA